MRVNFRVRVIQEVKVRVLIKFRMMNRVRITQE